MTDKGLEWHFWTATHDSKDLDIRYHLVNIQRLISLTEGITVNSAF